jgi:hypothetical protein
MASNISHRQTTSVINKRQKDANYYCQPASNLRLLFGRLCAQLGQQGTNDVTRFPPPKPSPRNDNTALSVCIQHKHKRPQYISTPDSFRFNANTYLKTYINVSRYPVPPFARERSKSQSKYKMGKRYEI